MWFVICALRFVIWDLGFVDTLNQIKIKGFKLGFWFAQQGAIYVFVVLIFVYVFLMNKLDKKFKEKN